MQGKNYITGDKSSGRPGLFGTGRFTVLAYPKLTNLTMSDLSTYTVIQCDTEDINAQIRPRSFSQRVPCPHPGSERLQ